jgi:HK97 family phage major capsid protein
MSENIDLDLGALKDEMAELRRSVEVATVAAPTALALPEFRSYGEFVQAFARSEESALDFAQRAASTSADAALRPGFLGAIDNLIRRVRVPSNAFQIAALPAAGLTVEYAKVNTNTIATGKQTTENTALTDGNIAWSTVSANVATYGSQTSVSRQFIERATVDTLGGIFTALAIGYAKKTNDDVVATLAGLTWTSKTFDASALTTAAVIGAIADGSSYIFANSGMSPEFIVCDPTAFKKLITIVDTTGRPVALQTGVGDNNIGNANISGLTGSIAGLPVLVDPALAANTAYLANSMAVQSLEAPGAPVRLTNDVSGVNTLTNTYAVYGYGVFSTVPFESAIVKIKVV